MNQQEEMAMLIANLAETSIRLNRLEAALHDLSIREEQTRQLLASHHPHFAPNGACDASGLCVACRSILIMT